MKFKCGVLFFLSIFFLQCSAAHAFVPNLEQLFERLKSVVDDYEIAGSICEQVAKLHLESQFPPDDFKIEHEVAYSLGSIKKVLGELDLVVIRKKDQKVVLVAEVKCWHDIEGAQRKAADQKERFRYYINDLHSIHFFKLSDPRIEFLPSQFDQLPPFILISQDGGLPQGFDMELPYSLDELMELRMRLVQVQIKGFSKKIKKARRVSDPGNYPKTQLARPRRPLDQPFLFPIDSKPLPNPRRLLRPPLIKRPLNQMFFLP
ncbi:MAG: hypothetical protein ACO3A2_10375 [Bdellovibrionia bacterium]